MWAATALFCCGRSKGGGGVERLARSSGCSAGDVDTLGMMADLQVTLGNLERASELYDEVIVAVRNEADAEPLTSWDC